MSGTSTKTYLKSIGWLGIGKVITQAGTWCATLLIARILSPADYGLVGMAGLVTGIVMLLGDFGLGSSIIRKETATKDELSALVYTTAAIGFMVMAALMLIAPFGADFFGEKEVANIIRLSSISFFISSITQVPVSLMQKEMNFKKYSIIDASCSLAAAVVTILLAMNRFGAYSLVGGTLFNSLVRMFIFFPSKYLFRPVFSLKKIRGHLKFGGAVTLERYLWYYYSNIDYLLAGKFIGKAAYGTYSMAYQLAYIPVDKIATILIPTSFPFFSSIGDGRELVRIYFKILRYLSFLSFPVFSGLFWTADDLLPMLLGEKWRGSIFIFKVMTFVCTLSCLSVLNTPLLNSVSRPDVGVKNMLIGSIVSTAAFSIGILWGIKGLSVTWLLIYPPLFMIYIRNVSKTIGFPFRDYFANLKIPALITASMSFCLYAFQLLYNRNAHLLTGDHTSGTRLLLTILIGIASYLVFAYIFDRQTLIGYIEIVRGRKSRRGKEAMRYEGSHSNT